MTVNSTQRDRQTRNAGYSSKRLAVFLFCIDFQERMVQVAITGILNTEQLRCISDLPVGFAFVMAANLNGHFLVQPFEKF